MRWLFLSRFWPLLKQASFLRQLGQYWKSARAYELWILTKLSLPKSVIRTAVFFQGLPRFWDRWTWAKPSFLTKSKVKENFLSLELMFLEKGFSTSSLNVLKLAVYFQFDVLRCIQKSFYDLKTCLYPYYDV